MGEERSSLQNIFRELSVESQKQRRIKKLQRMLGKDVNLEHLEAEYQTANVPIPSPISSKRGSTCQSKSYHSEGGTGMLDQSCQTDASEDVSNTKRGTWAVPEMDRPSRKVALASEELSDPLGLRRKHIGSQDHIKYTEKESHQKTIEKAESPKIEVRWPSFAAFGITTDTEVSQKPSKESKKADIPAEKQVKTENIPKVTQSMNYPRIPPISRARLSNSAFTKVEVGDKFLSGKLVDMVKQAKRYEEAGFDEMLIFMEMRNKIPYQILKSLDPDSNKSFSEFCTAILARYNSQAEEVQADLNEMLAFSFDSDKSITENTMEFIELALLFNTRCKEGGQLFHGKVWTMDRILTHVRGLMKS